MSVLSQTLLEAGTISNSFQLTESVTSIVLGNGQGEYSYDPLPVLNANTQTDIVPIYENINVQQDTTLNADCKYALDQLQQTFPNLSHIYINICWYVNSLDCSSTGVVPKAITTSLSTEPYQWSVGTINRGNTTVVSSINGIPAFMGTPSDNSLLNLILDLNSRNLSFSVCLGLLCDIPTGTVGNPYSNSPSTTDQPTYPPSSMITCSPAYGYTGQAYGTAAVTTQIDNFFGPITIDDYSIYNSVDDILVVNYSGPVTTGYNNFVSYYAALFGSFITQFPNTNMYSFIIGKQLSGLTNQVDNLGNYPAVINLVNLAQACHNVLNPLGIKVSYLADWDEWAGIDPSNIASPQYSFPSLRTFNMDPLWSSDFIDFIAIAPNGDVTDWRSSGPNLDSLYYNSPNNPFYILSGLVGGPYYDYYYATQNDRDNQTRTIINGVNGDSDAWVYRLKDYTNWLSNKHYDVISNSGVTEYSATATSWVPNSKQIVFLDVKCPSVNNGSNQPSAYINLNSSESAYPYFSNDNPDTAIMATYFSSAIQTFNAIKALDIALSYWDIRPFPWYPLLTTQWIDSSNYTTNSTINNKLVPIDPTSAYLQYVDYSKLLTNLIADNDFYYTFFQAAGEQWNLLFHKGLYELSNLRNVEVIPDELKAATVRNMGFRIPNYGLTYAQYTNLMKYYGSYLLTRGGSIQFVNFLSFISNIKFDYVPLFANGLNYTTLSPNPGTLVTAGGTWIPTPYYDIYYNSDQASLVPEDLFLTLFKEAAPAHLVLRALVAVTTIPASNLYVTAQMTEKKVVFIESVSITL